MPKVRRSGGAGLDERLRRWVEAGIISGDQAREVLHFEASRAPRATAGASAAFPLVAEVLAYVGIALVSVSGTLVVLRFWHDLGVGGRLGVAAAVSAVGLGAGALLGRADDAGARRLGAFLSLCGTGGVGLLAGVAAVGLGSEDPSVTALAVGVAVFVVSVALWRNRERALSFLSSLAGATTAVAGLQDVVGLDLTPVEVGWAAWGAGAGLVGLGWWRELQPARTAMVVGAIGALGGASAVADRYPGIGVALGLGTALAVAAGGLGGREPVLAGLGIAGLLIFLTRTLTLYARGTASALVVFVVGIALVGVAVEHWRHHGGRPRTSGRD